MKECSMNEEMQAVEMTIGQAEHKIAQGDKWQTLLANPLFEELVTKDYLGDDAVRLAMNLKPDGENDIVNNFLMAKSVFSRFVGEKLNSREDALQALEEHKNLRAELGKE